MTTKNIERCKNICGGSYEHCIINNKHQLECISDMVVNKTFTISLLLKSFKDQHESNCDSMEVDEAMVVANELSNWVKYLQITRDLKFINLLLPEEASQERRSETRFPLPRTYQKYLLMEVGVAGQLIPVTISNFSQRGIQFQSPVPLEKGLVLESVMKTLHCVRKEVHFKIRIRYCAKKDKAYLVGARIEEILDNQTFNFFNDIYDFVVEIQKSPSHGYG